MNRIYTLLLCVLCSHAFLVAAPSIRRPSLPKGLSPNKTAQAQPKERVKKIRTRKKRKGLTHRKQRFTLSNMNLEELEAAKNECMQKKRFDSAGIYLDRLITMCEDIGKKAEYIIELGNLYFRQQKYTDAKKRYQEFERLYPGNQLIEHAKKQIVLCTKQTILSFDRDQAPTQETLELAQNYLDQKSFTLYRDEMEDVKKECQALLAQSECGITEFYIKQGNFKCAQRRIEHIRTEWLEKVPAIETALARLEVNLGSEWKEFEIPATSLKLVEATSHVKPSKKLDMTARF